MQLSIKRSDGTKQIINLHWSFATEDVGRGVNRMLTKQEIHDKGKALALDVCGDYYEYHSILGLDELVQSARYMRH